MALDLAKRGASVVITYVLKASDKCCVSVQKFSKVSRQLTSFVNL